MGFIFDALVDEESGRGRYRVHLCTFDALVDEESRRRWYGVHL